MIRPVFLSFLLAVGFALPIQAGRSQTNPEKEDVPVDIFDYFRDGTVRGIGLHEYGNGFDCYDKVNGHFPWTGHVGGADCVNSSGTWDCADWMSTPTHARGCGFDITCTDTIDSDTGRYEPDNSCEEGENGVVHHINTETDLALAFEMMCPGGEVYLPDGIYVQRGAGFKNDSDPSATYNMDGTPDFDGGAALCELPISRRAPGLRRTQWQVELGGTLRMESTDPDGRHSSADPQNIPLKSGTWIINDQGSRSAYRYGGTCSGGSRDGLACVHTSIDCPGGGTCSGGYTAPQWQNFVGSEGRARHGNRCSLVDEGGGDFSCDPDVYTGNVNKHNAYLHAGHLHLREAYEQSSPDICLSGFINDTDSTSSYSVICDDSPFTQTATAGASCSTGSVNAGPARSIGDKIIFEDHLQKGTPAHLYAFYRQECNDGTAECGSPAYGGVMSQQFLITGADAHCSVTTATSCLLDSDCPGGETCEVDTCDGGDGLEFWVDTEVTGGQTFPFQGSIMNENGNGVFDPEFYAMVVDPAGLAQVKVINGTITDNNYYDDSVATSNCNGCPADASGVELQDDTESMGMGTFSQGADQYGAYLENFGFDYVTTSSNSILDGDGVYMKAGFFTNTNGYLADARTFVFDHGLVENATGASHTFGSWEMLRVLQSTFRRTQGSFENETPNSWTIVLDSYFEDVAPLQINTGSLIFERNRINGTYSRAFLYDPEENTSIDLYVVRDNQLENVGYHGGSGGSWGRDIFSIGDVQGDGTSVFGRAIVDNNYVTTSRQDICMFHFSGRSCPNGTGCPSPTTAEIGRTFWTITNNTLRETETAAGGAEMFCVEPAGSAVTAATAARMAIDRFQPIRYGNTWNGTPVPDFPYQCGSIAEAPTAAEGPIGEYCFYDDDPGGHCVDTVAGTLDLSASAAFTCDGGTPADCDLSICVLHADGTWDEK